MNDDRIRTVLINSAVVLLQEFMRRMERTPKNEMQFFMHASYAKQTLRMSPIRQSVAIVTAVPD